MDDKIPVELLSGNMQPLLALVIAIIAAAFLRLLRIQAGGVLMLASIIFLVLIKPGWEKGVFIFDIAIMRKTTFVLFALMVSCEWLMITLSPQLKKLTGSLADTFPSPKIAALLLPALSTLAGSPRQGMAIVENGVQSKIPEDRLALVAWFRHLFTAVFPCLLFPIVLGLSLNKEPKEILLQLWPLFGIWFISGTILLRGVEHMKVETRTGYLPFIKVFLFPAITIIPCLFLPTHLIVACIFGVIALILLSSAEARQTLWGKRKELQIVRWLLLAAGISVWTWTFHNLLFFDPGSIPSSLAQLSATQIEKHSLFTHIAGQIANHKWILITALPFVVGFISGNSLLTAILITPIALTSNIGLAALLPSVGCAFLGSVLSYEHLSFIKLNKEQHGNLKNVYIKLIIPVIIAAILLAIISIR